VYIDDLIDGVVLAATSPEASWRTIYPVRASANHLATFFNGFAAALEVERPGY
jgi:hypothetical protein